MIAWMLVVAAAAQAPERPADYFASGSEPFWGLEIRGRRIVFTPNDGSESDAGIAAPLPRRQPVRGGYRLVTPRFTVLVRHAACEDEGERRYSDTVDVRKGGRTYAGCGGTLLPPVTLTNTDWRIVAIGRTPVDGDDYAIQFGEGRLDARTGCNRFHGPYTQRGTRLVLGQLTGTRARCASLRGMRERRAMQVLQAPMRISFPAGDVLLLTGRAGTIRLRRT
jgi:heat shock protein HslJ